MSRKVLGWDLDGVIVNIEDTKRQLVFKHFGIAIDGEVGKGPVSSALGVAKDDEGFFGDIQRDAKGALS